MTRDEILQTAAAAFGSARITTTLTNDGLHPTPTSVLEVKGQLDSGWRPVAAVGLAESDHPLLKMHPRALAEDVTRVAKLLNA